MEILKKELAELLKDMTKEEMEQLAKDVAEVIAKDPDRFGFKKKVIKTELPEGIKEIGFKDGTVLRTTG